MTREFKIVLDREDDGRWIATVKGIRGAHVYGKTKSEAIRSAKELALSYLIDGANGKIPEHISFVSGVAA
jgi:predicted RNase H-like HicB family nuclease